MKIDRHNYEEIFILYLDNELSSDQRRLVEEFVQHNPDLKEELDILSQYKLAPDTDIVFENKTALFRQAKLASINEDNYTDWLLLYIDRELSVPQRKEVEAFAAVHPSVKKELESLSLATLHPETIRFPDKNLLYRREVKTFSLYWRRIAAAIIIMLLIGAGVVLITGNNSSSSKKDIVDGPSLKTQPAENKEVINNQPETPNLADQSPIKETPVVLEREVANTKEDKPVIVKEKMKSTDIVKPQEDMIADNRRGSNNLPLPVENQTVNETVAINSTANKNFKEIETPAVNTKFVTNPSTEPSEPLYVSDGKKNKLRGFFRKVTRTFEKTTMVDATDENDRLLIGGLAIKLK